jgi:hypothetical protein
MKRISRRKLVAAGVAAPAIMKLWPALIREAKAVCTPTGLVPTGTLPEISALPMIQGPGGANTTQLPNLFVMLDGTPITTKAHWAQHRAEIKQMIQFYNWGHVPPPSPVNVVGSPQDTTLSTAGVGTMLSRLQNLSTGPGGVIPFYVQMYIPQNSGPGPFPVILTGEAQWSPLITTPTSPHNSAGLGQTALNTLVNMGFILAEFQREMFSWDIGDLGSDELIWTTNLPNCGTNLFKSYPFDRNSGPPITIPNVTSGLNTPPNVGLGGLTGYDWGVEGAWVWGGQRAIDYLMSLSYVDHNKVAVCGISRGSGFPFYDAGVDERIAISMPNQGIGLVGTRCQEAAGANSWGINSPTPNGAVAQYYSPRWATLQGGTTSLGASSVAPLGGRGQTASIYPNCGRLPWDAHTRMALIAPRAFLGTEALFWSQSSPCGVAQEFLAGQRAWAALGAPTTRAYIRYTDVDTVGSGGHEMTQTHWTAMVNFCQYIYYGTPMPADNFTAGSRSIWCSSAADFQNKYSASPVYGGLPAAYNWSTPTLT